MMKILCGRRDCWVMQRPKHSSTQWFFATVFCNGLYFALRSGKEHRQLRLRPCQVELVERDGERAYLKYTEDISKNRPGGIKGRKVNPKIVYHHASENPERCFLRLFKKYIQLCPDNPDLAAFYLQPLKSPTLDRWYSTKPLGHNTISKTISRLCSAAGILGYKTNHSLRATAATRLYQSGIDEQLVMERTGHRSLEGVRAYKRTSEEQREVLSDILNRKEPRIDDTLASEAPGPDNGPVVAYSSTHQEELSSTQLSSTEHATTNIQTNTKNSLPGTFNFNSCSSVTFHIQY